MTKNSAVEGHLLGVQNTSRLFLVGLDQWQQKSLEVSKLNDIIWGGQTFREANSVNET